MDQNEFNEEVSYQIDDKTAQNIIDGVEYSLDKNEKTVTIDIQHDLTEGELKELSNNITNLDKDIDTAESQMEGYKAQASIKKKEIDNLDSERRSLSRKYRDGFENRTITCRKNENYATGLLEYIDINTNEIVKTESLTGIFSKEDVY